MAMQASGKRQGLDLDIGRNHARYMEEAGFEDSRWGGYKVPFWKGAEKEVLGSGRLTEHVVGDQWGLYWHAIPGL